MKTHKLIEVVLIALVTICGGTMPMAIFASVLEHDNVAVILALIFAVSFFLFCVIAGIAGSEPTPSKGRRGR